MKVRIKTGTTHGHDGRHLPGDIIEVTEDEFAAFGDKFILVEEEPAPVEEPKKPAAKAPAKAKG
jgi:hypothetical protein